MNAIETPSDNAASPMIPDADLDRRRLLVDAIIAPPDLCTVVMMGVIIRKNRRRVGLTINECATQAEISKPYLSLMETGQVLNPPSDDKLARIESVLKLPAGSLIALAMVYRTPTCVRELLADLLTKTVQKTLNADSENITKVYAEVLPGAADGSLQRASA
jgi:transcriptional regulator with XRE-family HTH domain